jgi:hypothetical protein
MIAILVLAMADISRNGALRAIHRVRMFGQQKAGTKAGFFRLFDAI